MDEIKFTKLANFTDKQKFALAAIKTYAYTLYGGAMGGSKSYFLRWALPYLLMWYYEKYALEGVVGGIFCEDYPALDDRQIKKSKEEYPSWLGTWHDQDHEFILKPEYGRGVIAFRNLDKPSKYDSTEFAVIAIDEAQKNPYSTFKTLRRRNRWKGIRDCRMILTANPGDEAWVQQLFIDRQFPPEEQEASQFYFVQALPKDNPYLDESYWIKLRSMPEAERKAYEEGDWNAFSKTMDDKGYLRLLSSQELNNAFVEQAVASEFTILGVDPGAGVDESSIVKKTDLTQSVLFNQKLSDTMALVGLVVKAIVKYKAKAVVIDRGGIGQAVYDRLVQLKEQNSFDRVWEFCEVIGVMFGEKSSTPELFRDLKAEMYWKNRQWILTGGKLVRNDGWNEFLSIKYKRDDKMIFIQSKEELRKDGMKSPNVVDAAAMTMIPDIEDYKTSQRIKMQRGSFYDKSERDWREG